MNEQLFADRIRQALESSTERLPYRVTQRLERSRAQALARIPQPAVHPGGVTAVAGAVAAHGGAGGPLDDRPSLWIRLASTLLPLALVIAGLYGIAVWQESQDALDTADIDAALLTDDIPISAYADRGFGVYLKNTRQ